MHRSGADPTEPQFHDSKMIYICIDNFQCRYSSSCTILLMGSKKYLLLTPNELRRVLKAFGFVRKHTRGDHEQWEGLYMFSHLLTESQA